MSKYTDRYKDGRTQTAFRLSDDSRRKLQELAELDNTPRSDVIRKMIDRSHSSRIEQQSVNK